MQKPSETPRVTAETVGQERPTSGDNKSGFGRFLGMSLMTWILVVITALIFAGAIIAAAIMQ